MNSRRTHRPPFLSQELASMFQRIPRILKYNHTTKGKRDPRSGPKLSLHGWRNRSSEGQGSGQVTAASRWRDMADCPSLQAAARIPRVETSRALCLEEAGESAQCLPGNDWQIGGPRRAGGVDPVPLSVLAPDTGDSWNVSKTLAFG